MSLPIPADVRELLATLVAAAPEGHATTLTNRGLHGCVECACGYSCTQLQPEYLANHHALARQLAQPRVYGPVAPGPARQAAVAAAALYAMRGEPEVGGEYLRQLGFAGGAS